MLKDIDYSVQKIAFGQFKNMNNAVYENVFLNVEEHLKQTELAEIVLLRI